MRTPAGTSSAAYGSFVQPGQLGLDAGAFGISSLEMRSIDPQQKFVLCVGYTALCAWGETGSAREALLYLNVGVFVGVELSGFRIRPEDVSVFSASGGALSVTSGRLSHALGLVGPCYSIDTACASALAALHACRTAVVREECHGGLGIGTKVLSEAVSTGASIAGMTSLRGRCHTFDHRADGYCRGEGCGGFVLSFSAVDAGGVRLLGSAV